MILLWLKIYSLSNHTSFFLKVQFYRPSFSVNKGWGWDFKFKNTIYITIPNHINILQCVENDFTQNTNFNSIQFNPMSSIQIITVCLWQVWTWGRHPWTGWLAFMTLWNKLEFTSGKLFSKPMLIAKPEIVSCCSGLFLFILWIIYKACKM